MAEPRDATVSGPKDRGITPREADVLNALEEHLTNAEIAARLFLSERTVEDHVSSLLRKFGATNRRELVRTVGDLKSRSSEPPRPTGTVTFVFTDIVGSSELWELDEDAMRRSVERHDAILGAAIDERDGRVFATGGDGLAAVFARADDAVCAAVQAQQALVDEAWLAPGGLRVRFGIHTGEAHERDGNYFGPAVNRASRIMRASAGAQILVSSTTAELVGHLENMPTLADLGERQLRGLKRPQRVFDVEYPGRPQSAARAEERVGRGIAAPMSALVGRDAARDEIAGALHAHRLVTLIGAGGIGKTSLAEAVAFRVAEGFTGGVRTIELAAVRSHDAVSHAFAQALGVLPQRDRSVTESIIESYRNDRSLFVVDNCEHVIHEASAIVGELLNGCPQLHVLATSREPLQIRGEQRVAVQPLPLPREGVSDTEVAASPAVQLFRSRAAEAGRAIEPDGRSLPTIADICRLLSGIPLAIELAANRARALPPDEMLERLRGGLELPDPRRDSPERQRTMSATIDWSFQLLEPPDRVLFARLGIFLGGFTLDAAEAVCSGEDVAREDIARMVWALVDRSLVHLDDDHESTRYVMLEPIRQFALEQVAAEELPTLAGRHLGYFRDLAHASVLAIRGPKEATWVRRLNAEFENLRSAFRHGVESRRIDDTAQLVADLHDYAIWRQRFELGTWAEELLGLAGTEDHPSAATLFATAGWGRCIAGDFDGATAFAERGLAAERSGATECGWLHDVLAHAQFFQGSPDGLHHSRAEIDRARRAGDRYRLAYVLADNGAHEIMEGNAEIGVVHTLEAFELAEAQQCPSLMSMARVALSMANIDRDPPEARRIAIDGSRIAGSVDANWARGVSAMWLILLCVDHGDPPFDLLRAREALDDYRRAGDDVRVRNSALWSMPALVAFLPDASEDLARLYGSIVDRPVMRADFADARLDPALAELEGRLGEAFEHLVDEGHRLTTSQSAHLALKLLDLAREAVTHATPSSTSDA